jgi:hypothetical protein
MVEDLPTVSSALEKAIITAGIELVELLDRYWLAIREGRTEDAKKLWNQISELSDLHQKRVNQYVSASDPAKTANLRRSLDALKPLLQGVESLGTKLDDSVAGRSAMRNKILEAKKGVNDISIHTRDMSQANFAVIASGVASGKGGNDDLALMLIGLNSYNSTKPVSTPQAKLVEAAKVIIHLGNIIQLEIIFIFFY